jgi:xanthine dehydrogenase YagT iron-sulfur-binding subunit
MPSEEQDARPEEIKNRSSRDRFSRRSFLSRLGAAGAAVTAAATVPPLIVKAQAATPDSAPPDSKTKIPGSIPITLRVNGQQHQIEIDPRASLLDTLRETLHLTGTKKGCWRRKSNDSSTSGRCPFYRRRNDVDRFDEARRRAS